MGWDLKTDLAFGRKNERLVISYLNSREPFESEWFVPYRNQYNQVDFSNWKMIGELKSRKNSSTKYPDTMFGENKMKYLKDKNMKGENRIFRFYFLFTDGLFSWEFDPNKNQLDTEYTIRDQYHKEKHIYEKYCFVKPQYLTFNSFTFENEETTKHLL